MRIDHCTPVVLLPGGQGHGATCIARSLGRLGVPVYSVEGARGGLASFSCYCKRQFVWNDKLLAAQRVQFLQQASQQISQPSILLATTDDTAAFVAENADALQEWFIFPKVNPYLVHSLCDKKEMYHLANKLGIATPKATFPTSRWDVLEFLETAAFPIMLKGIDGNRLAERSGHRMYIVGSKSELLKRYDSVEDPEHPNLMLQEYIPGNDDAVCGLEGYFNEFSDCAFAVTGRKLRQWPAYQGVTTLGICLKNEVIEKITNGFMKAIGYRGILDIGYRYDVRDGLYKVLDVNPRIGCTFRLFAAENGMDVARALYLDLTGQPVVMGAVREGRKWVVEDLDMLSSLRYMLDRKLTLIEWLRSFRGVQESAYFAADDPLPFVAMCLKRGKDLLWRICLKLTRRRPRVDPLGTHGRQIGVPIMIPVKTYLRLRGYSRLPIVRWLLAPFLIPGKPNLLRRLDRALMRLCPGDIRLRHEFNRWAENGFGESMGLDHLWLAERIIPKMNLSSGDRILDLGCGDGWACRFIAEHSGVGHVVGLDVSDEMVRRARVKSTHGENLAFVCASAEHIPYPDEAFTRVLSISAFYYFEHPETVLTELLRVVAPGGRLFLLTCLYKGLPDWSTSARGLSVPVQVCSADEYKSMLQAAGWRDVHTEELLQESDRCGNTAGHDRALFISAQRSSCEAVEARSTSRKAQRAEDSEASATIGNTEKIA